MLLYALRYSPQWPYSLWETPLNVQVCSGNTPEWLGDPPSISMFTLDDPLNVHVHSGWPSSMTRFTRVTPLNVHVHSGWSLLILQYYNHENTTTKVQYYNQENTFPLYNWQKYNTFTNFNCQYLQVILEMLTAWLLTAHWSFSFTALVLLL